MLGCRLWLPQQGAWFCTHKLAWNAVNPFPHRLFRWRSRGGGELRSLMLPPIGRRGDPLDMLSEHRAWSTSTGLDQALWIPGVGDHGGGPTEELLEQLAMWEQQPLAVSTRSGSVRDYLQGLDASVDQLPVWRDELYLELHRGCATSRPDQKRHNRVLERLLREADTAAALLALQGRDVAGADWTPLLFQQFHDILPGTSIPEVFEQAEPVWRAARRQAVRQRDQYLAQLTQTATVGQAQARDSWVWCGLQPLARWSPLVRLPRGRWSVAGSPLPQQNSVVGGTWVQLPQQQGISSVALQRDDGLLAVDAPIRQSVRIQELEPGVWRLGNGLLECDCSAAGLLQLRDQRGVDQLAGPLLIERFADRGEFWDAWDLAAGYRDHPLGRAWGLRGWNKGISSPISLCGVGWVEPARFVWICG